MLQQTQVARVVPHFLDWLERWPSFGSLAEATLAEVIEAWVGFGYNRRALNLHRLACEVVGNHESRLPLSLADLLKLPGIGPYTANAVLSFACDWPTPVADTNIACVLARVFGGCEFNRDARPAQVRTYARALLPETGARDHNLALMDLGALVCTRRKPACNACPISSHCRWLLAGSPRNGARAGTSVRFEDTARFARGRIVDALRTAESLSDTEIASLLPPQHAVRTKQYLAALARDGLVEQYADGRWSLPGRRFRAG
jgi:A/G-specific adenine glycosylase